MNSIKIATALTNFARKVSMKLLEWRWKANLKHAETSVKASKVAAQVVTKLEQDADKQLADAAEIREAMNKLGA